MLSRPSPARTGPISRFVLLGPLAAALTLPLPLTAHDAASGTLSGRVVSAAGAPAADARVELLDFHLSARVDKAAAFRFENLPAGEYLIQAVSPRFGTGLARVDLAAGATLELEIPLTLSSQVDEVVVSAGGGLRSSHELSQTVGVLSGEELSLRAQPSLGETLAQEPGVSSSYFAPGSSRPVIRGLGGDRVRMLQDGLGTGDASSTSVDHAVSLEASTAERIEVLRGPATLLYGSSATGGVVNVIDGKIPTSRNGRASGSVELRGGTVSDERTGTVELEGGGGRWAWHVEALTRSTDDFEIPGSAELAESGDDQGDEHDDEESGVLRNSDIETDSGALGLSYFLADNKGFLGVSWSGFDTQYGLPIAHADEAEGDAPEGGEPEEGEEDIRIDLEQRRVDLRGEFFEIASGLEALKVRLGVADYQHVELEGAEIGTTFANDEIEGRIELVQRRRGPLSGSFGLQVLRRDFAAIGEEAFVPPNELDSLGLFVYEELDRGGPLTLQFGGRYERHELSARNDGFFPLPGARIDRDFDGLSASFGLVWQLRDATSLGFSLARSTKLPNAEELFSNGLHVATQSFERGNLELDEETNNGLELSLRHEGEGRFSGEVHVFFNRFEDFIFQAFTGEEVGESPVLFYTQGDAEFAGAELRGRWELWRRGERHVDLQLFGDRVDAELTEAVFADDGARLGADGDPLPRIPPWRYGAGLHYHDDRIHGMVEWRRVERQDDVAPNETETAGYSLLNASLSYRIFRGSYIYDLLLRGTNLTDEEARNHVSFLKDQVPLPGRDLSLALRFRF